MRAIAARLLRRSVYGKGHHPGPVEYFTEDPGWLGFTKNLRGCRVADKACRDYQALKRAFRQGRFVL